MPTPATAPPSVMVLSCGTTAGMTPCARHSRVRSSYAIMPSASTVPSRIASTWLNERTSSRRRAPAARSRKRFEVSLARATGPAPCFRLSTRDCRFAACVAAASAMPDATRRCRFADVFLVDEVARHRVGRGVALGEHDLEKVRAAGRRAEHLGAAVEIDAPDAPEAIVEARRVERADPLPVALEALGPDVEGQRVMPAQVLDVENLEPALLHLDDHVGEARDPAAGEHVLADEEIGIEAPDVADEVDEADSVLLEEARMRADDFRELVAAGVLEAADRDHLVELLRGFSFLRTEVGMHLHRVLDAELLDLPARVLGLRAGGVDARDAYAVMHGRMHQEAAEARTDVDHFLAGLQAHFPRDVVGLGALRVFERARSLSPVRARVEHVRIVEPQLVELGRQRVMRLRVGARARARRVRMRKLVPAVAQRDEESGAPVEAAFHAGGERLGEAPFDVEVAVEVGLEEAHVAEGCDAPIDRRLFEYERKCRRRVARPRHAAIRVAHREGNRGALSDGAQRALDQASHGAEFYRRV